MWASSRLKTYTAFFVLFFLEASFFSRFRICGASPELLLAAVIFFGFHFGTARGAETGLVAGFLKDVFSTTGFGVNTFSFLLAGALAGYLKKKLARENFVIEFFISAAAVYLVAGVSFLELSRFTGGAMLAGFWGIVFHKSLYTAFTAPLLFFSLGKIFTPVETSRI